MASSSRGAGAVASASSRGAAIGPWPTGAPSAYESLAAGASSMPSSVSKGSTAIAGSIGDSLSCPSASSEAAVAASRRIAELTSCSARRASSSGDGSLQEAGGELMQQAADVLGGIDEQARFLVGAVADDLGARERVLERSRQVREIGEADRRRAAGERMGERDRHFADRAVQLHRPLGDLGHEAARQLVGLVEVDVEERDADPQRADDLDVLVARRLARAVVADLEVDQARRAEIGRRAGGDRFAGRQVERQPGDVVAGARSFARRQVLDHPRRVGRAAEIEVDPPRRHLVELLVRERRLHRIAARIVEAIEHGRRVGHRRLEHRRRARRRAGLDQAIEVGQVELERQVLGLGLGLRGGRLGRAQVEIGAARQVGRHADRQGDVRRRLGAGAARQLGGSGLDLALVALAGAMRGDVLDPVAEVAQHPLGELDQRRLGGALLGELRVEDLLARPRRLAERLQPDHARAALERVEGAPQRRQQLDVAGRRLQLGARGARRLDDLARFLEEDLAHLVVVLEVLDQRDRRHRRERHRRADRREAGRLGRRRDEIDERFGQLAARAGEIDRIARLAERVLRLQDGGGERRAGRRPAPRATGARGRG